MGKHKTQPEMVLRHLQRRPITRFEAESRYGVIRLAAIVDKLKKAGHGIVAEAVTVRDRHGHRHRTVRYRLLDGPVPAAPMAGVHPDDAPAEPLPRRNVFARLWRWLRGLFA